MGPTMARMARRAFDLAGVRHHVIGVSRFRDPAVRQRLEECGRADQRLRSARRARCPRVAGCGRAWCPCPGSSSARATPRNWRGPRTAAFQPLVCRRYRDSRIVAFSTGNVYGPVPHDSGGSRESDAPHPDGEYAMSALGRERIYEYFSKLQQTPLVDPAAELCHRIAVWRAGRSGPADPARATGGRDHGLRQRDLARGRQRHDARWRCGTPPVRRGS